MLKTKHSLWHSGSPGSEPDMILPTWYGGLNTAVKDDATSSLLELHLCGYCESSREEDSQSRQGDIAYCSWRKKNAVKRKWIRNSPNYHGWNSIGKDEHLAWKEKQ